MENNIIERLEKLGYSKSDAFNLYEKYLKAENLKDLLDYIVVKEIVKEGVA